MKKTKKFENCFLAELEFSTEIENMISALNRLKRLKLTCCKRDRSVGINSHGEGKHTGRHGLKYVKFWQISHFFARVSQFFQLKISVSVKERKNKFSSFTHFSSFDEGEKEDRLENLYPGGARPYMLEEVLLEDIKNPNKKFYNFLFPNNF